ncbi:hypothetical protein EGW08_015206, partial [Elysia chlorotica]
MSGNGTVCHGTIAEQVLVHPNLTQLARYMANVPLEMLLLSQNDSYTFFAPSDAAMKAFLTDLPGRKLGPHWNSTFDVMQFLNFHTIYDVYSISDLKLFQGVLKSFPTLYDGFSLHTINAHDEIK